MTLDSDTTRKLNRLMPLKEALEDSQMNEGCLTCKIMGATAFFGLGMYSYFSGKAQLRLQKDKILRSGSRFGLKSRQAGITTIAMTLLGMGFWRLVN
ncbi:hypothetical protein HI914_03640 [Erysiphe necator]|uniref:DUF4536 domain-containing protein n=1 Tax=Uncinula necator TaxID=52586 RepID=A0A0B1PCX4_UNCNE|nr:hypothetical protein HI914_03640 [Erysiphe necator]KHJ36108.1 hypothetical protein EV44_g2563 [Erysiphe necator]